VSKRLHDKRVNFKIDQLLNHVKEINGGPSKIGLATLDGIRFEDVKNIMYLRAEGNYTYVHIKGNIVETVSKSLKDFEDILPETAFCRVHHSFIVSIDHIKKYFKGRGGYVEMEDGASIEIAARKRDEFLRRFAH
jgi:two-component system LytT family response regulator